MLRRGKEHNVSRCLLKIESIIVIKGDLSSPVTMFNLLHCRLRSRKSMHSTFSSLKDTWVFLSSLFFYNKHHKCSNFHHCSFRHFSTVTSPNLHNLKDKTILKNICFQIKNLIERQRSIFDRHETIAYTLIGMTTEQLQICNSSKCHLHTKVNKIYHLIHQIFSLEFTISEMHVQQCSMRI